MTTEQECARYIAHGSLEIGGVKINPRQPFQWASGFYMPMYNDNRLLLGHYAYRKLIGQGFVSAIRSAGMRYEIIAGTSTAGIPPATTLSDMLFAPLIYVRDKPKDHGMKNRIEGIPADKDLENKPVILIEDLVSTGGSSVNAVQGVRDANGVINNCLSIFSYGFDEAQAMFDGNATFKDSVSGKDRKLNLACELTPLLTYETLIDAAIQNNYISRNDIKTLDEWRADPFTWGERNGFPRIVK